LDLIYKVTRARQGVFRADGAAEMATIWPLPHSSIELQNARLHRLRLTHYRGVVAEPHGRKSALRSDVC